MTDASLAAWAGAFALTQAVEAPIYVFGARVTAARALTASALTHPVAWFVAPWLWRRGFWEAFGPVAPTFAWRALWVVGYVALAEGFAVSVEAWWLRRSGVDRPWRWSLAANGASATLGFVLDAMGWTG